MKNYHIVYVLSVPIFASTLKHIAEDIVNKSIKDGRHNLLISATSSHGLVFAKRNNEFKDILCRFYINLPDGMPIVWVGRLKGHKLIERCSGVDFFEMVMVESSNKNINHFLCGGKPGVADELKIICERKFGNKNIVGTFTPPFREMSEEEIKELADQINSLNTNIVWIGLSTPKQEIFAYRLSKYTNVNFICTIGAAFDFHTGKLKRAPKIIQNLGFEWLYRLLMEPKRLWRRYFEVVPLFIYYNIKEFLNHFFAKFKTKGDLL